MTRLFEARPFIIAEIGSNWETFDDAKDAVSKAKAAGADAVKFQAFKWNDLYGSGDSPYGPDCDGLPVEWLPKLKEKADACGIELMCTAFSPELVKAVDPFVSMHKVASAELSYPQLLESVRACNKPVLLSVGGSAKGDVRSALSILQDWNPETSKPRWAQSVVLLYCVAAYPCRQWNLFQMDDIKAAFGLPIGLSDHSVDVVYPALSAVKHFGAIAIEKHVNFVEREGFASADVGHSLNGADFVLMCEVLRGKRPYGAINPQPEERDMFKRHNRRLIATRDIPVGGKFRFGENYGVYRSLEEDHYGLTGFAWEVPMKSAGAKREVKAGDAIGPNDF